MIHKVETEFGGRTLTIETGKMAKQAGGAVTVRCGDTIVLVTAVVSKKPKEGTDFLPLTVDFIEKTFAAGKIPGGFFKREGRPTETATLTSRFIDRPIRPLFPEGYFYETQVIATVLSVDPDNEPDVLAMIGASASLMLSEAPFQGPIAGVRVGRIDGVLRCNPTIEEMNASDIDLIVAASRDAVVMVEGGAEQVSEAEIVEAILFAHKSMQKVLDIQEELAKKSTKTKIVITLPETDAVLKKEVEAMGTAKLAKAIRIAEKGKRSEALSALKDEIKLAKVPADDNGTVSKKISHIFEEMEYNEMREMVLGEKIRIDGRKYDEIRPITSEVGLLPRAHGSALFTRGETQALVATTLGSGDDEQTIDALQGVWTKRFMLHYNFPPFSTGEVKFLRSPGRREIGHGALAERSLLRMIPPASEFPYTIRIVSEILESNGSSSMASVCGGTLSLMDAGVPIKSPVAGIAMGLVKEGNRVAILSDILGDEDHLGDMDFKVTGTEQGVTALQMDIKIAGVTGQLLSDALDQAKKGRLHILGKMKEALSTHRTEISPYAPRIHTMRIDKEKIGALIGPGGKNIRGIIEETGVKIDVEDDGTVNIFSSDGEALKQAIEKVQGYTAIPEVGKIYKGKVVKIAEFGAFVQIMPNTDGLLHISQIDYQRVNNVRDVLNEGDEVDVKVIRLESDGKIALSRKETMPPPEGYVPPPPGEDRPPRRDFGDRGRGGGPRDRGRGGPPRR
jgi:polyribonucleotide nucleotidyltransferase